MFDFEDKKTRFRTGYVNPKLHSVKEFNKIVKTYKNIRKQDVNNLISSEVGYSEGIVFCNLLKDIGVNRKIGEVTLCDLYQCVGLHKDNAKKHGLRRKAVIYVIDCKYAKGIGEDSCQVPKLVYNNTMIELHKNKIIEFDITKTHGLMTNSQVKLAVFFFKA